MQHKNEMFEQQYNMEKNLHFGRFCESGIAVVDPKKNEMMCVQINEIRTNFKDYKNPEGIPAKCRLMKG